MTNSMVSRKATVTVVAGVTIVTGLCVLFSAEILRRNIEEWLGILGELGAPQAASVYLAIAPWSYLLAATSLFWGVALCNNAEVRLESLIYFCTTVLSLLAIWVLFSMAIWIGLQLLFLPIGR